jgi:hypothetical protein
MLLNVAPNLERRNSHDGETIDPRKKDEIPDEHFYSLPSNKSG